MQHPVFGLKTPSHLSADLNTTVTSDKRKRQASPVSISEAARSRCSRRQRHAAFVQTGSNLAEADSPPPPQVPRPHRQSCGRSSPATPEINHDAFISEGGTRGRRLRRMSNHEAQNSGPATPGPSQGHGPTTGILSPTSMVLKGSSSQDGYMEVNDGGLMGSGNPFAWPGEGVAGTSAGSDIATSLATSLATSIPSSMHTRPTVRPRPSILDTTAAQDISLPSPSLSPVTAAANLQSRRGYFDDDALTNSQARATSSLTRLSGTDAGKGEISRATTEDSRDLIASDAHRQVYSQAEVTNRPTSNHSMMNIPTMLDSFEAMPAEMKTYVMYQLLRRCPKPVLQFVGDTVNPALKCDFLSLLPLELSLNIIGRLDVKSLCRAAQVSMKWRQIIDSGEDAWRRLCEADGYHVTDREIRRAIREGWGWQHTSHPGGWERDLGANLAASDTEASVASAYGGLAGFNAATATAKEAPPPPIKRTKRKAAPKSKSRARKQQKTAEPGITNAGRRVPETWMNNLDSVEGPYAAASAAAISVACPQDGLPRLRNLHLFKSIYRRHHMINSTWMQEETMPRHIAFRAHQRYVVTCLQFDEDKILTGSDDNKINIYDTQTGALRAQLEGHTGGVWALQYLGNVLVSGSTDRSVRVWDIEKGVCTQVFQGHTSTVRCLQILTPKAITTSDGKTIMMPKEPLIITGSRDSNLRVWKLPTPTDNVFFQAGPAPDDTLCPFFVRVLAGHTHSVRAIDAYGDTLVSGSYDCTVRVWRISTGETLHRLQGHTQKVYSVVLDHERNRCISGSMDTTVKVWSLDTGSVLFNLDGHSSLVGLLDLQEGRLVSAAADSTLRIWDPENGQCKSVLSAHTGAITCFQHDKQKVISGSDRTLKMWNVTNGHFVKDLLTDLSGVWQVKFDGRRCVAAVQRNSITYIEVKHIYSSFTQQEINHFYRY